MIVKQLYIFVFFCVLVSSTVCASVDVVVFSYNRPMQLYALLESMHKYMSGIGEIHIIYRSDSRPYTRAYEKVFQEFSQVIPHKQGNRPQHDFKDLTVSSVCSSPADYIIFAVDDIIVKDTVDLNQCAELLNKYDAYGFYLRLGKNLTYNYTTDQQQAVPQGADVEPGLFRWRFKDGCCNWAYPNTVDMTLYRKSDIKMIFEKMPYANPNELEGRWAGYGTAHDMQKSGLCFDVSKIVNIPLNRVQNVWSNRHMNSLQPWELLRLFNQGLKIDIAPLHRIVNKSAHMEYELALVGR